MPIRFRCAYCNQLMGISRRKAGTIVRCPTCAGQVVVPDPGQAEGKAAAEVFEQPDFDAPLQQPAGRGRPRSPSPRHVELEPVYLDEQRGFSAAKMLLLVLLMLVLLAVSFLAGMLVGHSWWPL